jgi:hypothetical protein
MQEYAQSTCILFYAPPDHHFQQMHDPLSSSNTMDTHHIGAQFSLNERAQGKFMCSFSTISRGI